MRHLVISILLALVLVSASSQPKVYITLPRNVWKYNETLAARVWYTNLYMNSLDTVVNIYIGKSVYWRMDSVRTIQFSVDSIKGRGDLRKVFLTSKWKTTDTASWYWEREIYKAVGDTSRLGVISDRVRTTDSTCMLSEWLEYTRFSPQYPFAVLTDSLGRSGGWRGFQSVTIEVDYCLEKILGDPTVFQGRNQLARLRFLFREKPPMSFMLKYLQ